jgi:hypothetical protein
MNFLKFTTGNDLKSFYAAPLAFLEAFYELRNSGKLRGGRIDYYGGAKTHWDEWSYEGCWKISAKNPEFWRFPRQCVNLLLDDCRKVVVTLRYE